MCRVCMRLTKNEEKEKRDGVKRERVSAIFAAEDATANRLVGATENAGPVGCRTWQMTDQFARLENGGPNDLAIQFSY